MRISRYVLGICLIIVSSCNRSGKDENTLFKLVSSAESGIAFANNLAFDKDFNIYTYRNFYNGGGVALGDINNDGLIDIYLTGNMVKNKLYLNKGNFQFEDITEKAGVAGQRAWSTGVSMADVNGDGWLDIYVCNSGDVKGDNKQNELFINNHDLTFSEEAEKWGVADKGYTTHAAFFDYDKDGDLDLYILNNSYKAIGSFNLGNNERNVRDSLGGDKLMRNDGDHFTDVSEQAGIYGSIIGFGLGVTVGDVNDDQWPDIYVSNDFFERDYLYLNNHDGTFKECLPDEMRSISGASMGADMADINNDGHPDLFVTEMLPKDNARLKTVTTFENWNRYQYDLQHNYYHQFTRNMLQLNNGDSTFSEIGRLAGVEASDWSWGALVFDMDNDGMKDIFIANGIFQDLTDQDFLNYASNEEFVKSIQSKKSVDYKKLTEIIPSHAQANCAFRNLGNAKFEDDAEAWGLGTPGFSNGSAYGDLDNDGDLDLVVNNVNMPCFVYRNQTHLLFPDRHYLKVILKGEGKNTSAFGSKLEVEAGGRKVFIEQMPVRGFESTVDPRPNLGLGNSTLVDRLTVTWPDGRVTRMDSFPADTTLVLDQRLASINPTRIEVKENPGLFEKVPQNKGIDFVQAENDFVDFDRDKLIFHMLSREGPRMSTGDINGDGRTDLYIGGAKDHSGAMYMQKKDGSFIRVNEDIFENDKNAEDLGSTFFDADGDGDQDLYVCSGGIEFSSSSSAYLDRLYLNDGTGKFTKSKQLLPTSSFVSTSTVKAADYDGDGDEDLFVGSRVKPFLYGVPVSGFILNNDGHGNFTNVTKGVAPALSDVGMITDALWTDVDGDGDPDLIVVGEYMPIKIFINENGKLQDKTTEAGLEKSNGWWNRIEAVDLDNDGDTDFIIGNHGLNSRFRASETKPVCMYINDFDKNGTAEQIICAYVGDKSYPMVLRHDLVAEIPSLKKKYLTYESYKDQTITDIFGPDLVKSAVKLDAYNLATSILINEGGGKFSLRALPEEAQFAPVYGIESGDFDGDGNPDILLGGNFFEAKPEVGRYDASYGVLLKGDGSGGFRAINSMDSGLKVDGEVRDIVSLSDRGKELIIMGRNSSPVCVYQNRK